MVHQVCALQMFQARMDREVHALRRRRSVVAKRAISLAGISCRPLGVDDKGREYWIFPSGRNLFIRKGERGADMNIDKEAFNRLLLGGKSNMENGENNKIKKYSFVDNTDDKKCELEQIVTKNNLKDWKVVTNVEDVRRVGEYLGDSVSEADLKVNLMLFLSLDRKERKSETDLEMLDKENREQKKEETELFSMGDDSGVVDNTPVALKLMITSKNPDVLRRHVIDQEQVFEEVGRAGYSRVEWG